MCLSSKQIGLVGEAFVPRSKLLQPCSSQIITPNDKSADDTHICELCLQTIHYISLNSTHLSKWNLVSVIAWNN